MAKAARWGANDLSVLTGLATSLDIVQLLRLPEAPSQKCYDALRDGGVPAAVQIIQSDYRNNFVAQQFCCDNILAWKHTVYQELWVAWPQAPLSSIAKKQSPAPGTY
jgi:hypothetical protein